MRVLAAALVLAAAPAAAEPSWGALVGDWRGTLRWTGCTAPGPTTATAALDAIDGTLILDLHAWRGGLGTYRVVDGVAQDGDTSIALALHGDTLAIGADVGTSGCRVTATLSRPASACPSVDAWTRIARRCTRSIVCASPGTSRPRPGCAIELPTTGSCSARADRLERALVDVGCAPNPAVALVRASTCQALPAVAAKLGRCTRLPAALRAGLATGAQELVGAAQTVDAASQPALDQQCRSVAAQWLEIGRRAGC